MRDSWFLSDPTYQSIIRDVVRFKGIINMEHTLFPKAKIKNIIEPFPGGTHLVMDSVGENVHKIYGIGYKYF